MMTPSPYVEPASRRRFRSLMGQPEEAVDLAEAALLIACEEYPNLDVAQYRARFVELGVSARARLDPAASTREQVGALSRFLFEELDFKGNSDQYYDPRNSFLNEVLNRRLGIPISLSALYIEVGRQAGLQVDGVGLPGHFIVRVDGQDGAALVDPFHGGALLTAHDCQERLDRIFEGKLKLDAQMLQPCGTRQILARMLYNLKGIYVQAEDHLRALGVVDLLLLLEPNGHDELRDRGLLYAALDCYGLAVHDLTQYLDRAGNVPEAADLKTTIETLRTRQARVN